MAIVNQIVKRENQLELFAKGTGGLHRRIDQLGTHSVQSLSQAQFTHGCWSTFEHVLGVWWQVFQLSHVTDDGGDIAQLRKFCEQVRSKAADAIVLTRSNKPSVEKYGHFDAAMNSRVCKAISFGRW